MKTLKVNKFYIHKDKGSVFFVKRIIKNVSKGIAINKDGNISDPFFSINYNSWEELDSIQGRMIMKDYLSKFVDNLPDKND